MLEHLRPLYARNFRCLGSQCEDNCCRAWEVVIDRETYQRYERTPELRPFLQENFSLIREGATDDRYATIKFTASSTCPFLSPEHLCSLQQRYGEDYLSPICASYPRTAHRVDGLLEYPLSLSCIEAARLVLLNPQLLPRLEPLSYSRLLKMSDALVPQSGNQFRYFWDVREFCFLLVQDRRYPLWQRLFLMGAFCKRLGEQLKARQFGLVPKLLRDYAEVAESGKLRDDMEGIPLRASVQVKMVLEVALTYLQQRRPGLCRIQKYLEEFLQGIGYRADASLEACTRNYVEAYTCHYARFMEKNPHLLENYLINHIFRVVFPFGLVPADVFERPEREYVQMCLEFSVIKGLLIGMAGYHREAFGVEHVVKVVQALAKSMEHDPSFGKVINWQGLSDASSIAALLKN